MRGALHVLSTIVLLPYIALAFGFLFLSHAISSGSLFSFFETLLAQIAWLFPWGLLGFACAIALVIALGLIPRLRWLGGLCLCLIAASCLVVILTVTTSTIGLSQLLFLLPCFAILVFGGWLAVVEWRSRRLTQAVA